MSAILGTLSILGGSAELLFFFVVFCLSPLISKPNEPSSDLKHIPGLHRLQTRRNYSILLSRPSEPAAPCLGTASRTRTSYKGEAAAGQETGAAGEKGELRSARTLRVLVSAPAHRATSVLRAAPGGPSVHPLHLPGPRTLQSTATASGGMMSASSPLLGSSFLASFWARAELNVTFTMAQPGTPSEGGGGGLEGRAAGF